MVEIGSMEKERGRSKSKILPPPSYPKPGSAQAARATDAVGGVIAEADTALGGVPKPPAKKGLPPPAASSGSGRTSSAPPAAAMVKPPVSGRSKADRLTSASSSAGSSGALSTSATISKPSTGLAGAGQLNIELNMDPVVTGVQHSPRTPSELDLKLKQSLSSANLTKSRNKRRWGRNRTGSGGSAGHSRQSSRASTSDSSGSTAFGGGSHSRAGSSRGGGSARKKKPPPPPARPAKQKQRISRPESLFKKPSTARVVAKPPERHHSNLSIGSSADGSLLSTALANSMER